MRVGAVPSRATEPVHAAVQGIAQACIAHPDQMLYDLLAAAIDECATWAGPAPDRETSRDTAPWLPATSPGTQQPPTDTRTRRAIRSRNVAKSPLSLRV